MKPPRSGLGGYRINGQWAIYQRQMGGSVHLSPIRNLRSESLDRSESTLPSQSPTQVAKSF